MNAFLGNPNQTYGCRQCSTLLQKDSYTKHSLLRLTNESCEMKFPMSNTTKWTKNEQKSPVYVAFYVDIECLFNLLRTLDFIGSKTQN